MKWRVNFELFGSRLSVVVNAPTILKAQSAVRKSLRIIEVLPAEDINIEPNESKSENSKPVTERGEPTVDGFIHTTTEY